MKDVIYKFLDDYVGGDYKIKSTQENEFHSLYYTKSSIILSFRVNYWKKVTVYRSELSETVSKFFSINSEDAGNYIEKWFCEKHKLEKIENVLNKNGNNT